MAVRELDIVLRDCRIVDGCGNPWYAGDLGVRGRRIARISPPRSLTGRRVIAADEGFTTILKTGLIHRQSLKRRQPGDLQYTAAFYDPLGHH